MKLPANTSLAVAVEFVNASGVPVDVQGAVSWESSDAALATVVANADDSHMATITAGPSAGEVEIFATGDADLGEGVREVEATLGVTVIAKGEAVGGEISPVMPGHGLPGQPGHPDNTLPSGGRPSHTLPPAQRPTDPGFGVDAGSGHVDAGLPGGPPITPDNTLPGSGADTNTRPDNTLPEGAQPKT